MGAPARSRRDHPPRAPMSDTSLALSTRGLKKSYGSRLALDGLDLTVPTGVVYGFLGPNGAGKTTTMRVLTGLIHPDGGRDRDARPAVHAARPPAPVRRRRARRDRPAFYPYLSGRENLRALAASGAPVRAGPGRRGPRAGRPAGTGGDKVSRYSLGMKQRLGIAGALLNDPKLLLLDEPANGLDPAGIVAMRETLRHLAAIGKTVFVSSHLLSEVQQMADVVGIIAAGQAGARGHDAGAARRRGRRPRAGRSRRGRGRRCAPWAGSPMPDHVTPSTAEPGWISVQITPERSAEVNRALGEAGIWVSGLSLGERPRGTVPHAHRGRLGRRSGWHVRRHRPIRRRPTSDWDAVMRLFRSGLRKLSDATGDLPDVRAAGRPPRPDRPRRGDDPRPGRRRRRRRTPLLLITFPGAYDNILAFMLGLGGLFGVIYGAAIAGSEWTWGTFKTSVARGESRSRYLLRPSRRSRSCWPSGC